MVTPVPERPLDEAELAGGAAQERPLLERFLDYHRRTIKHRIAGLSEEDARRRLVPSKTTLIGIIKHLAAVERAWFQRTLAGRTPEQIGANARGDTPSWDVPAGETITDVIAEYDAACAVSRQLAAGYSLDHTVPHHRLGRVSLRWIYIHMIEETAQHNGHADILREQIDGATALG